MPSAFSHMILAGSLTPFRPFKDKILMTLLLALTSSAIPDLDVLAFRFGVRYGDMMGHRGFTHSIVFAILWALLISWKFYKEEITDRFSFFFTVYFFFLCTISHGLLDACTDGGKGVGFFIPFSAERYFFPFRPIPVAPLSASAFFTHYGWEIFVEELKFILPICISFLVLGYLWRKKMMDK